MKILTLLLILSIVKTASFAQNENHPLPFDNKEPPYDIAPQYPGGSEALMKYFSDSIRYPEPEKSEGKEGYVIIKFVVTKKGFIKDIHPVNGVPGAPNFIPEAIRVLQSMPVWIPATKKGKRVEAEYHLSIPFKIRK